jgi:hypothetical protein
MTNPEQIEQFTTQLNAAYRASLLQAKDKIGDEPTPNAFKLTRPGRGGQTWNYVEIFPMLRELKRRYPIHFFHTIKIETIHAETVAVVELEIWEQDKPARRYIGVGSMPVPIAKTTQQPVSIGDAISGSITLAKKKAMAYAGIYPDVYGDDASKYTLVAQASKDELLEEIHQTGNEGLYNQVGEALGGDVTIEEFMRIRRDVDGIIENQEIERGQENT